MQFCVCFKCYLLTSIKKQLHNSMLSIYSDKNVYPRLFLKCFMRFDLKVRIISHKKMSSQDVHSMSSPTEMPGYALYLEFIHARYLSLATSWCWCYCCCVPNPIGRWVCEQQTVYCHKSENNCCLVSFFFVLFSRARVVVSRLISCAIAIKCFIFEWKSNERNHKKRTEHTTESDSGMRVNSPK